MAGWYLVFPEFVLVGTGERLGCWRVEPVVESHMQTRFVRFSLFREALDFVKPSCKNNQS